MTSTNIKGFGALAAAAAIVLAGCATSPEPRHTASTPYYTPTARSDERLEAQASAFESFMHKASGIDASFSGPGEVSQALQTGASHEPKQFEAGMIAYAAMAALQEPGFVAGVQRASRDRDLANRLTANPELATDLPGGDAAAARANAALFRQGEALADDGQKVKRAAYSVQHQAWSKARVPDPAGRLSRVKRLSTVSYQASAGDEARMRGAVAQGGRRGGATSPVVARGVALAALSVLGQSDRGRALMSEPRTAMCLRMAKLNLYQCLASAGPHYEDIFCLGQHAMIDPGQCVVEATKAPTHRMVATKASYRR
ncbi:hypothetical protein [Phenylobacterium hankyongense]|uniref:hypothetical protein n=1 Tax=Phenylobacterium hankyongense TaxID=1813876 RepID=UPI0010581561|nr:hypothetical protein [Phenylobacterium hankyongense]